MVGFCNPSGQRPLHFGSSLLHLLEVKLQIRKRGKRHLFHISRSEHFPPEVTFYFSLGTFQKFEEMKERNIQLTIITINGVDTIIETPDCISGPPTDYMVESCNQALL